MKKTTRTLFGSHAMCVCMIFKIIVSRPSIRFQGKTRRKANQRKKVYNVRAGPFGECARLFGKHCVERKKVLSCPALKFIKMKMSEKKPNCKLSKCDCVNIISAKSDLVWRCRCLTTLGSIVQIYEYDVECLWCLCSGGQTIETKQNVIPLFSARKISLSCLSCRIVCALSVHFGNPFDCH